MQITPVTWVTWRDRLALGNDPFDPRANILAGTAYLREMHDHYGSPGFLAAYNAGPARYEEHLATGRPLPAETRTYVAMLVPMTPAPTISTSKSRPTVLIAAAPRAPVSGPAPPRPC